MAEADIRTTLEKAGMKKKDHTVISRTIAEVTEDHMMEITSRESKAQTRIQRSSSKITNRIGHWRSSMTSPYYLSKRVKRKFDHKFDYECLYY